MTMRENESIPQDALKRGEEASEGQLGDDRLDLISGFHHLTACVGRAQEDIDFFTQVVGQRMVKQTVLFDGTNPVYHLYYADEAGTPGTVSTTFPYRQIGWKGRKGTGQVKRMVYSVPSDSLDVWVEHFDRRGVEHDGIQERFGQKYIAFYHPAGLELEVLGDDRDERKPWSTSEISENVAVRGIHSVTLSLRETAESEQFMDVFGFKKTAEEGPYTRFEVREGGPQKIVDFLHEPDVPQGSWTFGEGTVHHVAFAVVNDEEQKQFKDYLEGFGFTDVSDQKDRNYFHSIYVRMPGGVLFEVATSDIGFTIDEPQDKMGQSLQLPPFLEDRREELVSQLEPIDVPQQVTGGGAASS
jgi:glyoxalase family protein